MHHFYFLPHHFSNLAFTIIVPFHNLGRWKISIKYTNTYNITPNQQTCGMLAGSIQWSWTCDVPLIDAHS